MTFMSKGDFFSCSNFACDFFLVSRGIGKVCYCVKGHPYPVSDVGDRTVFQHEAWTVSVEFSGLSFISAEMIS